ncbi:DEAD/DEAH box helicase [Desulforhabdus amnigena]|jgi:Lhr-like helicase|uniref:DEAD/DEAH box helicase n=1 Tax=Desulforhabdus amnigena TaxID=40218 RepID=A0A9W6FU27_9BACT|nr:DEAD/DEAH box helicase [Desulforhabdus amnigena]NLJ29453.1 DEAD/DEAH box helicase [Deltaproteobacteria bacterium]GLI34882.1 hypothetical protein DAMNIGENAA_23150 [Desulforhabdus amnigena]
MPSAHDTFDSPLLLLPNTYRTFYGSFSHLHSIQKEAIEPVLAGRDLVVQSATGSGKTEAVLAPCIEKVIRSKGADAVLYIVPTRALAIDLERRLAPILGQRLGLNFGIRTGDAKRTGGGHPHLMLTTPESLDVLMGSSNKELQRFVQRVRTVIIDEVHPLVHQYRGRQLACLLQRLERRIGAPVQKIALSATISDVGAIMDFFGFRPDAVHLLSTLQREIVPHLIHIKREEELVALLNDLHDTWKYRKALLFANSRGQCDRLYSILGREGRFQGVAELHYSNLKPKERRGIENRFRRRDRALCIATSTLELGIDIGDVDAVLLFGPPDSVSAFLQRIGRSNRRRSHTHFWGICRGERAGEELLRFLALLRLARRGAVEKPLPNRSPSVMVQQILSCLYEKKHLSLPAMQALFPDHRETLELLFDSMEKQGWLRNKEDFRISSKGKLQEVGSRALFHGGWRYRNALLDRKIWSNFPETEEDYLLELEGKAVADLPRSIVRQLEPGDRVHLAGKRIQILQIVDAGERKRVLAQPAEQIDDKEILWLGAGFQVSFEVAQSIRAILKSPEETADATALGLFARTRRLLQEELERNRRTAILANGIEVLRERGGFYRYRTFLGSLGNLILRYTIARDMGTLEDLYITSDEIGITSSHRIPFKDLSLPLDRDALERWVREHLRMLRALFPLNTFCDALPPPLLVEELTDFLYDRRVFEAFSRYLTLSSEVVSGDPGCLDPYREQPVNREPVFLQVADSIPLLALEKERWSIHEGRPSFTLQPGLRHLSRPLTGTMVGEYMRHEQCRRWLSFHFLPPEAQPPGRVRVDTDLETVRTERGLLHEKRVLDHIRQAHETLIVIEETDKDGKPRSLKERLDETRRQMEYAIQRIRPKESACIAQAVLLVPSLLADHYEPQIHETDASSQGDPGPEPQPELQMDSLPARIEGIGIPDLIRISLAPDGPLLEVGDIKDSPLPYYSQKWQVAFYALLLKDWMHSQGALFSARVSNAGFLITRPARGSVEPVIHRFDLDPYLAAFPALFQNMAAVLQRSPSEATWRLQEHCTTCPYFETCYREALLDEEIQFLPRLSPGALEKMRRLGFKSIDDASSWFEEIVS